MGGAWRFLEGPNTDNAEWQDMNATRTVVVLYEDTDTREKGVEFCGRLVQRFWTQGELDVSWWPFMALQEFPSDPEATKKAIEADLIIFAARPEGKLSPEFRAWIESWLHQRGEHEGVVVGLIGTGTEADDKDVYFRNVAHRGGMDYLTGITEDFDWPIPDSPDSYCARAHQVTGVLEGILQGPPSTRTRV
jgi:hypothetical protein